MWYKKMNRQIYEVGFKIEEQINLTTNKTEVPSDAPTEKQGIKFIYAQNCIARAAIIFMRSVCCILSF